MTLHQNELFEYLYNIIYNIYIIYFSYKTIFIFNRIYYISTVSLRYNG